MENVQQRADMMREYMFEDEDLVMGPFIEVARGLDGMAPIVEPDSPTSRPPDMSTAPSAAVPANVA